MCRLLLMNDKAFDLINFQLEGILSHLIQAFGGDGCGVAALWPDGKTRMAKSIHYKEAHASTFLRRWKGQGASWYLFHARYASVGDVTTRNCHPFAYNSSLMAHNGHDPKFAQWGHALQMSDSECITRTWAMLHLPLQELETVNGVFIGFHNGKPFVVKGSLYTNLTARWDNDGAMLLASELPPHMYEGFEYSSPLGRFIAIGEDEMYTQVFNPNVYYSPPLWQRPYQFHASYRKDYTEEAKEHVWAGYADEERC